MKYLCCLALMASDLIGMEAPFASPPGSPQTHSAPTSPGLRRKYTREQLLAFGQSSLSRSLDGIAIPVNEIRVVVQSPQANVMTSSPEIKTKYKVPHKRYGKK